MDDIATAPASPVSQPSLLEQAALYGTLREWFKLDQSHSAEWRAQAVKDFDFGVGRQWETTDEAALLDAGRPVITFNRALSIIKAVSGIEINTRHDTVYLPRGVEPGQVKANEILTGASQWMADSSDAADEQSEAFGDALICGMGWTAPDIGYEEEPTGAYEERKVDPIEMYWDRAARSKNVADARRVFRVKKFALEEARDFAAQRGAKLNDEDLNATWAVGAANETDEPRDYEQRKLREENTVEFDPRAEVYIVHAQWIEREPYWRVSDVTTGRMLELSGEQWEQYSALAKEHGLQHKAVKQFRRVYKQAYLGGQIIGEVTPCPAKDRFTYQCITGERDRNKGTWFGLVRLMRDPQMWANKWLSQTLHILNSTAKGGILAETDAFKDPVTAQETYAQPDAITWVNPGAIQKGKIMQKPGGGIPAAYVNLLEFAISSIRDVTGINMELLGLRDANQPGVLEAQRKQAAMTILATMFDSLKRFRKNVGRVRLRYIQIFLADGRLIRVIGRDGMQMVPLLKQAVQGEYEVVIEDAPTSPNSKEDTWNAIGQMLPFFRGLMTPEVALTILEYSPLPSKLVDALKALATKPDPMAGAQEANAKADIDGKRAKAEKDRADAEATRTSSLIELLTAGIAAAQPAAAGAVANINSPEPWKVQRLTFDEPQAGGPMAMPSLPLPPQPGMGPTPEEIDARRSMPPPMDADPAAALATIMQPA